MRELILVMLLAVAQISSRGQNAPGNDRRFAGPRGVQNQPAPDLPTFQLNFPGGSSQQLVEAIQKEIGTLNVIIPDEYKDEVLPELKLRDVNVSQLFRALESATMKQGAVDGEEIRRRTGKSTYTLQLGFRTNDNPITPESVWYFYVQKNSFAAQPKICRFYQLGPYLTDYKVEDITTAVQAGWKMLGEKQMPDGIPTCALNYHQDTKLLIAVGPERELALIDNVLSELARTRANTPASPPAGKTDERKPAK